MQDFYTSYYSTTRVGVCTRNGDTVKTVKMRTQNFHCMIKIYQTLVQYIIILALSSLHYNLKWTVNSFFCSNIHRLLSKDFHAYRHQPITIWFFSVTRFLSSVADPFHRVRMFLGLLDPDPDPEVRDTVPDPYPAQDPSRIKQK